MSDTWAEQMLNDYEMEEFELIRHLPSCKHCGHPIQTEYMFPFEDGFICWDCVNDLRVEVGDVL